MSETEQMSTWRWPHMAGRGGGGLTVAAEFRRAVNAALPDGVTLAGNMFLGPYEDAECEWDSPLDITAIISSIDLEPIIKAHPAGGGGEPAR